MANNLRQLLVVRSFMTIERIAAMIIQTTRLSYFFSFHVCAVVLLSRLSQVCGVCHHQHSVICPAQRRADRHRPPRPVRQQAGTESGKGEGRRKAEGTRDCETTCRRSESGQFLCMWVEMIWLWFYVFIQWIRDGYAGNFVQFFQYMSSCGILWS